MAHNLPRFVAFISLSAGGYAKYMTESDDVRGYVQCGHLSPNVYNPYAKIAVETAKIDSKYVHLRFTHTNKYWARGSPGTTGSWIFASSNQPEEDKSKSFCTLFEPTIGADGVLQLIHVHSGLRVRTDSLNRQYRLYVDQPRDSDNRYHFNFVDLDTLVIMPKHVVFKGDNELYLKALHHGYNYLQFSSNDGNEPYTPFEVTMHPDGYVHIRSDYWKKYWKFSNNWIWATSTNTNDVATKFWPVKVNDNTIALRASNNQFCKRLSYDGMDSCLAAVIPTITVHAKLKVEELVLERNIFNVRYRIEDARIFDEKPFVVGIGTATNDTDEPSSLTIRISYEDSSSHTFSNNVSIMAGVTTTIQAGIPFIAEGKIELSAEITTSLEWNRTTTETKTTEASYTILVPPMSTARVSYVATKGTCNIPFSYTQRDKSSIDGSFFPSQHIDGIFNGINYYSFHFEQPEVKSL